MKKRTMIWGFVPLAVAALMATGCNKEAEVPGLRIVEEGMSAGHGNKVYVDTAARLSNSWVAGEKVGIYYGWSDVERTIDYGDNAYYIDYTPYEDFVAWYPQYYGQNGGDVYSANMQFCQDLIYEDLSRPNIPFPMVAFGNSVDEALMFRHVTGALTFTVKNNTGETKKVSRASVWTYLHNIWPSNDKVLHCDNAYNLSYTSTPSDQCNFYFHPDSDYEFMSSSDDCISLAPGESFRCIFPVPVTSDPTNFMITFFDENGSDIIYRTMSGLTIERNHMYNLGQYNLQ